MDKKIQRIRKSIKNRKLLHKTSKVNEQKSIPYEFVSVEERHGMHNDMIYGEQEENSHTKPLHNLFLYQLLGACAVFLLSAFIMKSDLDWLNKPKSLVQSAFQENFPFASVHQWYVQYLGVPLSLVPQSETVSSVHDTLPMPLSGEVIESFKANGRGIEILPQSNGYVHAVNKGIVIFAGSTDMDKTIIIQHADRSETTYGKLDSIDVHLYEFVDVNEVIGRVNPEETMETLFFSIERQSGYVDPVKVINVDGE